MCWGSHASSARLIGQYRQMVVVVYVIKLMEERISKQAFCTNAMEWQQNIDNCIRYNGVRCLDICELGCPLHFEARIFCSLDQVSSKESKSISLTIMKMINVRSRHTSVDCGWWKPLYHVYMYKYMYVPTEYLYIT